MEAIPLEPLRRAALRPWLLILLTAPVLTAALGLVAYRWQSQRQDFARMADLFAQRQNKVLAHDATRVAEAFSHLLSEAAHDARLAASLPDDPLSYRRFFSTLAEPSSGPLYSRMIVWKKGSDLLVFEVGGPARGESRSVYRCLANPHCDRATLEAGWALREGFAKVGKGLRWYTPQTEPVGLSDEGSLSVVYRAGSKVILLAVDFRSFNPILRLPTFPYQQKRDLLQDYEDGNYIYLLDQDADLLAHPRRWHVMGLDRETGLPVPPMRTDADAGSHPLNFRRYREGKLRPYFDRLIAHSFQTGEVDVFQASNLSGQARVISVAPVQLDPAVFDQSGPFGYVGVGCALEHFQEPEERLVPYY